MRASSIALLCVLWVSAVTVTAVAQETPEATLAQIREQALHANYREALASVQAYLAREDLDAAERNAGLETLATIHIALRQEGDAREVLAQLYGRDPGHVLSDPDASPPVLSAFGRARGSPPAPVTVTLSDQTEAPRNRTLASVRVSVGEGLDAVAELRLAYRQGGGGFRTVVMTLEDDVADARVPSPDDPGAYTMSYYIEARAPSGHVLATLGSQASPVDLAIPEATGGELSSGSGGGGGGDGGRQSGGVDGGLIAVVVIVVLLVVGGGVTAGVFIADELSGPQDGSLGNIQLPLIRF